MCHYRLPGMVAAFTRDSAERPADSYTGLPKQQETFSTSTAFRMLVGVDITESDDPIAVEHRKEAA